MDRRLRELERRARAGDPQAQEELRRMQRRASGDLLHEAQQNLLAHPDDLRAWNRYIVSCHIMDQNPSLGDPYYRVLHRDIVAQLQGMPANVRLHQYILGVWAPADDNNYRATISLQRPVHSVDRDRYGLIIRYADAVGHLYVRVMRDGTLQLWPSCEEDRPYQYSLLNDYQSAEHLLTDLGIELEILCPEPAEDEETDIYL